VPFQRNARSPPAAPSAVHAVADVHDTAVKALLARPADPRTRTLDQRAPSHRSINPTL
jgi:hypothetical protein